MKNSFLIILLFLPLLYAAWGIYFETAVDPIKFFYSVTGYTAITLLFATTSISIIKSKINLMKQRKTVGLFSFFYGFLHLLNFVVLDMELDLAFALEETLDKPFIYLGMFSFVLLLFTAITSTKVLFKKYVKYHKVIYLILILTTMHFIMAQKALSMTQWLILGIFGVIGILKVLQRTKILHF